MDLPKDKGAAHSAMTVALVIALGEGVAYLGDLAFASHFGAGAASDAYVAANSVLGMPLMLLAACASATFMPHYLKRKGAYQDRFASNVLGVYVCAATLLSVAMLLLAQPLAALLHPGFDRGRLDMTVRAARIMLPGLPFMVAAMLLGQILEADGKFLAGQMAVFPRSVLLIGACALFVGRFGLMAVAASVPAAGVISALLLTILARNSFHYRPMLNVRASYLHHMAVGALPAIMAMGLNQINMLVSRALASGQRVGDMTAMSFSMQLVMLVNTVLTLPMTTVMYPRMSRLAASGDRDRVLSSCAACAQLIVALLIPAVCVGCVLHVDIVALAYGRGLFDRRSVDVTAAIFLVQLPGVLGMGLRMLFTTAFHAMMDTRAPLNITLGAVIVNIGLSLLLTPFMGVRGLALAGTLSALMSAVALGAKLMLKSGAAPWRAPLKNLLPAGLACLAVAWALATLLPEQAGSLPRLARLLACALPALAAYLITLAITGYRAGSALGRSL